MTPGPLTARRTSVAGIASRKVPGGSSPAELFIARRVPGGALGGKWEFPGGKVRRGETVEEALIREFQEEFSVPVRPLSFIGEAAFTHGETEFTLRGYGVELLSGDFTLLVHSAWRWAALEEIETLDFADSDRLLFPAVRAYLARL